MILEERLDDLLDGINNGSRTVRHRIVAARVELFVVGILNGDNQSERCCISSTCSDKIRNDGSVVIVIIIIIF